MVPVVESSAMVGIIIEFLIVLLNMFVYKIEFMRYFATTLVIYAEK